MRPVSLLHVMAMHMAMAVVAFGSSDSVVVFNEIMYHPASDEESEWIELHNQMSVDIDLSRWRLDGGVRFRFPEGTIIPAGGYMLIAGQPDAFAEALGPFEGNLNNGGEALTLHSASGRLMNEVRYDDRAPWPLGPDGSGASLAKVARDASAQEGDHWATSTQVGGTPGERNFPDDQTPAATLVINEWQSAWVELLNVSPESVSLDGHQLSTDGGDVYPLAGSLAPGAFHSVDLTDRIEEGDRVFLYGPDKATVIDAVRIEARAQGRFPDGEGTTVYVSESTRDASNLAAIESAIVINEILYHHRPIFAQEAVPFSEVDTEWIELYHRGDHAIDLSGWSLAGDPEYAFPEGTVLAPGDYLVIDNSEAGFSGNLPNRGGHIMLVDAHGNVGDEVRYFDDGHWPEAADGGGASLELRDPRADNAHGNAWAASDETARTEWQEIRYRGVAEPSVVGPDNQWRELVIGLLDDGEVLIDDIQVIEDPDGQKVSLINNGIFQESLFGGGPLRSWRLRGNHQHSEVVPDPDDPQNSVLRLVATGATGHMHDHIETTFASGRRLSNGTVYEIRYRARPVSGSPQILTRLYFNRLARTTILETPSTIGTPGAPNSRLQTNLGPTLSQLSHSPVVPRSNETVRLRVTASDPDGVSNVVAYWSVNGGDFESQPMELDDAGHYQTSLPAQQADAVVQFYLEATDSNGAVSQHPPGGPDSRALYQVYNAAREPNSPLHAFRIILHPDDTTWMHESINLMSNDRVPGTVIYREHEVFYDVGVRLKGSERGRVTVARLGYNVKFPRQQPFRGVHRTVALDRSEGVGTGQFELLFNLMMAHSGAIAAEHNDLTYLISPQDRHTGPAELQLARYGDIYLDAQFDDGSDGNLYEYELIYYPTTDDADGYKRPQPDSVVGTHVRDLGDDVENYRWTFLRKNNRKRDDYEGIMRYAKIFSENNDARFQALLAEHLDVDLWLQGMASTLLSGAGDQYGANSQHNGMFYERPDGKFIFFPHDIDFAFNTSRSMTENNELRRIIENPAYERLYLAHALNIIKTTYNGDYMKRWADHYGSLLPGQNFDAHYNYIDARSRNAKAQLTRMAPTTTFRLVTGNGGPVAVDTLTATIQGQAGIHLHRLLHVETGDVLVPRWLDLDTWEATLTLQPGENTVTLQGLDVTGGVGSIFAPVGKGSLVITSNATTTEDKVLGPLQIRALDTGLFEIRYSHEDSLTVELQGSTDLETWTIESLGAVASEPDGDGKVSVIGHWDGATSPARFLRLRAE